MPNQRHSSKDYLNRIPLKSTNETFIFINERNPTNINFTDTFSDIDMNLDLYDESFFPDEDDNFFFFDDNEFFDFTPSYSESAEPPFSIDLSSSKVSKRRHICSYSRLSVSEYDPWIKFKRFELLQVIDIKDIINNGFNIMKKNQNIVFKELKVHRNYVGHKIIDNNIIKASETFYNFIRIQKIYYYMVKRHEGKKKKAHAYYRNSFIHRYCLFL